MQQSFYVTSFNPRSNPLYLSLGFIALALGLVFDRYVFSEITLLVAYIPMMVMTGFLCRLNIRITLLSGLVIWLLYVNSPEGWNLELFLFRWLCYFLVAIVIKNILKNARKERDALINLTSTLAESIDARDKYTSFHSRNVAYYSYEIGKAMKLHQKACSNLYIGSLLHDIGKIGISESILHKTSRLTAEEFEQIKQHPPKGYDMLKYIPYFKKSGI
ncbi:HD-GYP domain-containing protein [Actinomycetes bacterium NPDC127524]